MSVLHISTDCHDNTVNNVQDTKVPFISLQCTVHVHSVHLLSVRCLTLTVQIKGTVYRSYHCHCRTSSCRTDNKEVTRCIPQQRSRRVCFEDEGRGFLRCAVTTTETGTHYSDLTAGLSSFYNEVAAIALLAKIDSDQGVAVKRTTSLGR